MVIILYFNEIHIVQKKKHRLWVSVLFVFVFSKQNPTYYASDTPNMVFKVFFFRNLMLGGGGQFSLFQRSAEPKSRGVLKTHFQQKERTEPKVRSCLNAFLNKLTQNASQLSGGRIPMISPQDFSERHFAWSQVSKIFFRHSRANL